jgi:hypothetical protein
LFCIDEAIFSRSPRLEKKKMSTAKPSSASRFTVEVLAEVDPFDFEGVSCGGDFSEGVEADGTGEDDIVISDFFFH